MSTAALMIVKNEIDVIETTVMHTLAQVDELLIADNLSDDGTRDLLAEIARVDDRVILSDDTEVGYYQSRKMTALALQAADRGHAWVVPVDADEIWLTRKRKTTIAEALAQIGRTNKAVGLVPARVFNHYATVLDNQEESNPMRRMWWRTEEPLGLPKTAVRLHPDVVIGPGNHAAVPPKNAPSAWPGVLEVRHFPYRSPEQFVSKATTGNIAYRATDLPRDTGIHWREYGERIEAEGDERGGYDVFLAHFMYEHPGSAGRLGDPQPELGLARVVCDPVGL
jgi:hypothetical protein